MPAPSARFIVLLLAAALATAAHAQVPRSLNGPFGEGAIALVRHPDGFVLALSNSDVYRSDSGGWSWDVASPPPSPVLRDVLVLESGAIVLLTEDGAFRSEDDGQSWHSAGLAESGAYHLAGNGRDDIYATSSRAVYRSEDGGRTWAQASAAGIDFRNIQRIYPTLTTAGTLVMSIQVYDFDAGGWVVRSTDRGETFESTNYGTHAAPAAIAAAGDSTVFIGAIGTRFSGGSGLFRSDDDGRTWERIQSGEVFGVHLSPSGRLFVGTSEGLFTSGDLGATLEPLGLDGQIVGPILDLPSSSALASTVHRCHAAIDPPIICEGVSALYRVSPDEARQVGLAAADVRSLARAPDGRLLAGTSTGIVPFEDSAWRASPWNLGAADDLAVRPDGDVLIASEQAGLFRLGDRYPIELPTCGDFTCAVPAVEHLVSGVTLTSITWRLYGGHENVVLRSSGSLEEWDVVLEDAEILAFAPGAGDTVYAGGVGVMYESVDGGASWADVSFPSDATVHDLLVVDGEVLAASSEGLFRRDASDSWSEAALVGTAVRALARSPDGRVFAATDDGLYALADDEWQALADWYDWPAAYALLTESDGTTYVGTEAGVVTIRDDDAEVEPDTLGWRGYFPLEIGNLWQYDVEVTESFGPVGEWIEQWEIVGDTTIGHRSFYRLDVTCDSVVVWEGLYTAPCGPDTVKMHYIRHDDAAANVEFYGSASKPWHPRYEFRLDAPFFYEEEAGFGYSYYPADAVRIGDATIDSGLKRIVVSAAVPGSFMFAHGVGLAGLGFYEGGGISQTLRYARTARFEGGRFFNVGMYEPGRRGSIALDVYPNPAVDAFVAELSGAGTGRVVLELFDVLGRQVRTVTGLAPTGIRRTRLTTAGLGAGVYYVVATIDGRVAARRELVVVR